MIRSHKGRSRQWLRATLAFKGNSAPGQPGHSGSHTTAWSQRVSATPGGQGESLSGHQKVQMWGSQGKWGPRAYFPVGVETEIVLGGRTPGADSDDNTETLGRKEALTYHTRQEDTEEEA